MAGSLRLMLMSLALLGVAAEAAVLSPEAAVEILARSEAANDKCRILSEVDAKLLATLSRQAQQTLASKASPDVAATNFSKGRKLGLSVRCDETTSAAVKAVLTAAQQTAFEMPKLRGAEIEENRASTVIPAMTDADMEPAIGEEAGAMSQATELDEEPVASKQAAAVKPTVQKKPPAASAKKATMQRKVRDKSTEGQLAAYRLLAERYYRERRCRNMSRTAIASLYSQVVSRHRAAVAAFGARAVKLTLQRARAQAASRGC
jgi:hypothetical protein